MLIIYKVICLGYSPEEAFEPFIKTAQSFLPFRDASVGISTFNISVLDCLRALAKAVQHNFFNYATFNLEEYQHFEKVENGDLNWIIPEKFIAFSGPSSIGYMITNSPQSKKM